MRTEIFLTCADLSIADASSETPISISAVDAIDILGLRDSGRNTRTSKA